MGILPLQYPAGVSAASLELSGEETFTIPAIGAAQREVEVVAVAPDGSEKRFTAVIRIDTPNEFAYFENGGILHYVLRRLALS
jgi:aconitate hydratase